MVGLSDTVSNNYEALLRFKKSIAARVSDIGLEEQLSSDARKINEYSETVVSKMKQVQKRLNDDEIKLLIAAYLDGKSTYALAVQFGCHRTTVSDILKRHNIIVTNRKSLRKLNAADVAAMYENMHMSAEIAEKYEGPNAIIRCLRSQGVEMRSRWDY